MAKSRNRLDRLSLLFYILGSPYWCPFLSESSSQTSASKAWREAFWAWRGDDVVWVGVGMTGVEAMTRLQKKKKVLKDKSREVK